MFNARELISLVDVVSKEKGLTRQEVISYMEDAMETALRKEFPETAKIKITIDPENGEILGNRLFKLVNTIEDVEAEMLFSEVDNEVVIDGYVYEPFPQLVDLNRQQVNITKQVVLQRINHEARNKQFRSLLTRNSLLFTGVVKVMKKDQMTVDYNGLDILIPRAQLLPREAYKIGDKVLFTIIEDRNSYIGSRTAPQFLVELLKQEVDELYDGKIEITSCVRTPGFRSRVIVKSNSPEISNPVRTLVGNRGANTNAVKAQLNGENITVIQQDDIANMLVKAISPVEIYNIIIDENTKKIEFSVSNEDVASVIGKQGKNITSLTELFGWEIDIYSVDEWNHHRERTNLSLIKHFMIGLNCDQDLAEALIDAGLTSIEFFNIMSKENLMEALDFDEETVESLIENANITFNSPDELAKAYAYLELVALGFEDDEIDALMENKIFSTQGVADLATDELIEILPQKDTKEAQEVIMSARKKIEREAEKEAS